MMLQRLVPCKNGRVTRGKMYKVHDSGHITDDQGKLMKPYQGLGSNGFAYWDLVQEVEDYGADPAYFDEEIKEKEMIKIEKVTLINGMRADKLAAKDIIDMIVTCRADIAELRELDIKSKYIDGQISTIEAAVIELTELLDAYS